MIALCFKRSVASQRWLSSIARMMLILPAFKHITLEWGNGHIARDRLPGRKFLLTLQKSWVGLNAVNRPVLNEDIWCHEQYLDFGDANKRSDTRWPQRESCQFGTTDDHFILSHFFFLLRSCMCIGQHALYRPPRMFGCCTECSKPINSWSHNTPETIFFPLIIYKSNPWVRPWVGFEPMISELQAFVQWRCQCTGGQLDIFFPHHFLTCIVRGFAINLITYNSLNTLL